MKEILFSLLGIGTIIFVVNKFRSSNEEFVCDQYRSFVPIEFNGMVHEKLIDRNDHGNHIVIYEDNEGDLERLSMSFDQSRFFEEVKPGDSIYKKKGDPHIFLNNAISYKVDYGCRE